MAAEPFEAQDYTMIQPSPIASETISKLLARLAALERQVTNLTVEMQNHRSELTRVKNNVNRLAAVVDDLGERLRDTKERTESLEARGPAGSG
jgi:chromosome segregation ATPase